jgi:phosphoglycerate dehydrogenase-like enzyme
MVREPEPALLEELREAVKAALTTGARINPKTTILIEGQLTEEHMAQCPEVRHIVIPFAGLQPKTREVLLQHPAVRAHNLHHNAGMTAEMAMALLLACARRIVSLHNEFRHDRWEPRYFCRDAASLEGKTVLVLGYGEIGRRVGRACEALGMKVVGVRTQADGTAHGVDELRALLPGADALVVTLPGTEATDGLIGEQEIALLPRHAIVVNVGRGRVLDQRALYEALEQGRLDAAGLDVWWNYPKTPEEGTPPSDYPFGSLKNVVMTPHVGGATRDAEPARIRALAALLAQIVATDTSQNLIDLEKGY